MKKVLLLLTFIFAIFSLTSCIVTKSDNESEDKDPVITQPTINEEDMGVYSVNNEEELKKLITLNNYIYRNIYYLEENGVISDVDLNSPTSSENGKETNNDNTAYKTNVQVNGVDEGDIVKVDGDYIYYLTNSRFLVFKQVNGKLTTVLEENYNNLFSLTVSTNDTEYYLPIELYTTEDYVVVVANHSIPKPIENNGSTNVDNKDIYIYRYYYPRQNMVNVRVYDKKDFKVVKEVEIEGYYLTSRLAGKELIVINTQDSRYYTDDDLRPVIILDGNESRVPYNKIKYLPENENKSGYTIFMSFILDKEITFNDYYFIDSQLGYSNYYINDNAIYFFTNQYCYNSISSNTMIRVFDYNKETGEIKFGGEYLVDGFVQDRYWADEYNGELRLVTTGRIYEKNTSTIFNYLYILKRKVEDNKYIFEEVSSIKEGIGKPGETIKSVRFNGNHVTIVTFENKDPLYYVDLTDSKNPVITSSLEVSGYSAYQHPYKDNYIIGMGYETNNNGSITGLKVSLYDATDINNVVEVGNPVVISYQDGYVYTNVYYNPKEILIDLDHNLFGFSIYGYDTKANCSYYVFKIDLNCKTPLSILAKIEYKDDFTNKNYMYYNYYYYYYDKIARMVYIDKYYYVLTNNYIETYLYDGSTFTSVEVLKIK